MSAEVKVPSRPKLYNIPTPGEVTARLPEATTAKADPQYLDTFAAAAENATIESRHDDIANVTMSPRVYVEFPWPPEPITPPPEAGVKAACEVIEAEGWERFADRPSGMRDGRTVHVWAARVKE